MNKMYETDDFEVIPEPRSSESFIYESNLSSDHLENFIFEDPFEIDALPDLRGSTTEETCPQNIQSQSPSLLKMSMSDSQTSMQLLQPYQLAYRVRLVLNQLVQLDIREFIEKKKHLDELLKLIKLYRNKLAIIEAELVDFKIEEILLNIYTTTCTQDDNEEVLQSFLALKTSAIEFGVRITEFSEIISQAMSRKDVITFFKTVLKEDVNLTSSSTENSLFMKRSTMQILLNIVSKDFLKKDVIEDNKVAKTVNQYIAHSDNFLQAVSFLILAFILESDAQDKTGHVTAMLILWLKESLENQKEKRSKNDLHVYTLLCGLKKLACFGHNKEKMLEEIKKSGIRELVTQYKDDTAIFDDYCQLMSMLDKHFSPLSIELESAAKKSDLKRPADVDLLIVGKTGTGKSATGNTILGRNVFKSSSSTTSVTRDVAYEVGGFDGRVIKVVDGPGVGDTLSITDIDKATKMVVECMQDAVILNPNGYHAFLLTIKYGSRFTAEDKDAITMLKKIFGEDFVKNYCILLVTCGDYFRDEMKDERVSFHQWCNNQTGVFKVLFQECNKRVVLFDNMTKDNTIREDQVRTLLEMVDNMRNEGKRYTNHHFQLAEANRKALLAQVKEPMMQEEAMKEISLILQEFSACNNFSREDKKKLEDLYFRATQLHLRVQEVDNGTGVLSQTLLTTSAVRKTISERLENLVRFARERHQIATEEEEIRKRYQEREQHFAEEMKSLTSNEYFQRSESQSNVNETWEEKMEAREKELREQLEEERRKIQEAFMEEKARLEHMLASQSIKSEEERLNITQQMSLEIEKLREREKKMVDKLQLVKEKAKQEIESEKVVLTSSLQTTEERLEKIKWEMEQNKRQFDQDLQRFKQTTDQKMRNQINEIESKYKRDIQASNQHYTQLKTNYDELVKKNAKKKFCFIF